MGVDKKNVLMGGGDLNARVGDVVLKLPKRKYFYRPNPDTVVNSHGIEITRICKSYNCILLNNLTKDETELDGKFTFHKGNRSSQNDVILTNKHGLQATNCFTIHDKLNWNPSDSIPSL